MPEHSTQNDKNKKRKADSSLELRIQHWSKIDSTHPDLPRYHLVQHKQEIFFPRSPDCYDHPEATTEIGGGHTLMRSLSKSLRQRRQELPSSSLTNQDPPLGQWVEGILSQPQNNILKLNLSTSKAREKGGMDAG